MSQSAPGPRGNLFAGVYLDIVKDPFAFLKHNFQSHPGISRFRIVHAPIVHVWHPEYLQHVLQDRFADYGLAVDRRAMKLLFRKGLLTNDGESWKRQRVMVQPAFQPSSLSRMIGRIRNAAEEIACEWQTNTDSFDAYPEMKRLVNRTIARCLLSSEARPELESLGDSLMRLKEETLNRFYRPWLPIWFPTPGNRDYLKRKNAVDRDLQTWIDWRRSSRQDHDDILAGLMAARHPKTGEPMSDGQLIDELISIYAAAHEPTATILMYLLYLLAKHPESATRIRDEVGDSVNEGLDFARIKQWPYMAAFIQEGLRLYPSVWAFTRRALCDGEVGPYRIRRGDNLVFCPYFIHRHPDYWPNAEQFLPERFLDGKKPSHPFAYLPYGGGPKYCIGSEFANLILKVTLASLTTRFQFYLPDPFELEIVAVTTLRPKHGLPIRAVPLQTAEKSVAIAPMRSR